MGSAMAFARGLGRPLQVVVGLLLLGLVVVGIQTLDGPPEYHARLRHAAGIEAGDDVRVAGLKVGEVTAVDADGDQVDVAFTLDQAPDELGITTASTVEVKLLSILGQRFLSLRTAAGKALDEGATLPVDRALDTYTIEEFWLESTPTVEQLDLERIQRAVDVLSTDLAIAPDTLRDALDGIAGVSGIVQAREEQFDDLIASTRKVTELVLDQTGRIDQIMVSGTAVLATVHQRREAIRALLAHADRFVHGLASVVRRTAPHLRPALRDLQTFLRVAKKHERDLNKMFELAGPTMRVFTNATGDGPWLGVNAPAAIIPDDLICSIAPEDCK